MARQYFNSQLADSSIVAASITPGTTKTFLFTAARANQFFPLPAGLGVSAPFAGQIFRFAAGGLITTPATGTLIIEATHGPGTFSGTNRDRKLDQHSVADRRRIDLSDDCQFFARLDRLADGSLHVPGYAGDRWRRMGSSFRQYCRCCCGYKRPRG
jgi:hypothetical protein